MPVGDGENAPSSANDVIDASDGIGASTCPFVMVVAAGLVAVSVFMEMSSPSPSSGRLPTSVEEDSAI
jgi:hypothetical protein